MRTGGAQSDDEHRPRTNRRRGTEVEAHVLHNWISYVVQTRGWRRSRRSQAKEVAESHLFKLPLGTYTQEQNEIDWLPGRAGLLGSALERRMGTSAEGPQQEKLEL